MATRAFPTEFTKLSPNLTKGRLPREFHAKRLNFFVLQHLFVQHMQVEYLLFASNLIGFFIHKVLSLEWNFLAEHCIVVFGHSTPSLQICTVSLGIWIRARQGFNGRTISYAPPSLHPQHHTHTLCHTEKWASSGYQCQAPLGFIWMGASLFLSLSLSMDYLSGTPPQQGRLMPLSHWTSYFACIL